MQTTSEISLSNALTAGQQAAIVGYIMADDSFFMQCKAFIKPEWLTGDILVAHIYQEILRFHDNYHMLPQSDAELLAEPFFVSQKPQDLQKYHNTVMVMNQHKANHKLEILRPKVAEFVRTMRFKEVAKQMNISINRNNYASAAEKALEAVTVFNEINFDKKKSIDFSDAISLFTKKTEEFISTGSKELDKLLGGGLVRRENMAVLAPTFTGKSRFLLTMARHLIVQGKKVLLITHEDNPEKIKRRIISSIIGIGIGELNDYVRSGGVNVPYYHDGRKSQDDGHVEYLNPEDGKALYDLVISQLTKIKDLLAENLTFIHWVKAGRMDIEDVIDEVRRVNEDQKTRTGSGFDVLINDYPAKLTTRKKIDQARFLLGMIYEQFNLIANELNFFCVYAVQVNRGSAKNMKSGEAESALSLEDVGESYTISQNAISAISLNRSPEDIHAGTLRIAVIKARDSIGNRMLFTKSAYNECVLYGDRAMFKEYGQFLYKDTAGFAHNQTARDTDVLNANLLVKTNELSMEDAEFVGGIPRVIKKIKNFPMA